MRYRILSVFVLLYTLCFAQAPDTQWTRIYGGWGDDEGWSVQQTSDGGYIIGGTSGSFSTHEIYVIKTDANGDTLWTKTFRGDSSCDLGYCIKATSDGGYVISGRSRLFDSYQYYDVCLIKLQANGDSVWTKTCGGTGDDRGYYIKETADGGYVVVGYTTSFGAGKADFYLIKTDVNGDTIWTKTFGGAANDYGYSVDITMDGGYIVAGWTYSFGVGSSDVYLIKTDANGDTIWTRTYGGTDYEDCRSVQQTADGGYIMTGSTRSFGPPEYNVYILRVDAYGDTLWTRVLGWEKVDRGRSVQQTSDEGFIVVGFGTPPHAESTDVYLIKINANGDTLWTNTLGGYDDDYAYSVQQTSDGGYIVAGFTESYGAGLRDIYLIKTEPDVGIEEEKDIPKKHNYGSTIIGGPFLMPEGKRCRIFDIAGRIVTPDKMRRGIYFVEIDGQITRKIVKVR